MAGGELPRGGKSAYFRRLSEHAPEGIRTRVTEFIESVAYVEELPDTAAATDEDDSSSTATEYAAKDHNHDGDYMAVGHNHDSRYYRKAEILAYLANLDHKDLQNIGTNTHDQIDTHIADATIHFTDVFVHHDGTTELTGEWGLGSTYGISEIPYLDFDLSASPGHQEGRLHWDDDAGTLELGMPGGNVFLQIGQEHQIRCRNTSGATILNGQAVYQTGSSGNKPLIALAKADSLLTSFAFGVATEDINHNSNGYVTKIGIVNDINTGVWPAATPLYLSDATAGALTPTVPDAPSISMFIGVVVDPGASGSISVNPTIVPRMESLSDVYGAPAAEGDFYAYNLSNTRFELDSVGDYLRRDEWLENGFDDKDDTALAWDDGTRTLTLSPAVTSFDYHYAGYKYNETGNLSATITDTEGLWVFYIGSGGAASLSTIHNPTYEQVESAILNECIVAYVYWDATNSDGRLMDERHGSILGRGAHHYHHEISGAQYLSGLTIGDITTDQNGNTDSHAQFSITAGSFYDEDLEHDTLAHASTDTWEAYYVDGSGNVRWTDCEATFPVVAIGGVIAYNNAGTLTAVSSNKYCLYHVFATNIHADDGGDYYPVVTPGTAVYNSKADAQDAALTEIQGIDFGDWPKEEVIPLWSVVYHHGAAMTNGVEAAIQSTEGGGDAVDWRFTAISGSSTSVNDHGALSGLADDDHPQYVLADGTRALTAAWNTGQAISGTILSSTVSTSAPGASFTTIRGIGAGASPIFTNGLKSDDVYESVAGAGVTVDGVLLKDDGILAKSSVVIEDGSSNDQHELASSGDVDLCQQGGQVTIGGTGGAQKLTIEGGHALFDNNYGLYMKDSGGTAREVFKIAGSNICNFGSSNNRVRLLTSDYTILGAANSAIGDAGLAASTFSFSIDESGHNLNFKVKYSDGTTVKSGSIALT